MQKQTHLTRKHFNDAKGGKMARLTKLWLASFGWLREWRKFVNQSRSQLKQAKATQGHFLHSVKTAQTNHS